jgi:catechol 2,3-dioxygenase-like lactoylglutathione lyase family enzyme
MARGLDHLVLASRTLSAQADFYRRLGFTVGARNRHGWGTINHIIQFDGTFLELISTDHDFVQPIPTEPVYSFAGVLADYLARREGLAMIVLGSTDALTDLNAFKAFGIAKPEPFFFERRGKRPDGSDVHVAFTLAFAQAPFDQKTGFFVCQQHYPENFWNPAFQTHANGVVGVSSVTYETADLKAAATFFESFSGASAISTPTGCRVATGRGAINIVRGSHQGFSCVSFMCADLGKTRGTFIENDVEFEARPGSLKISSTDAFGTDLIFETPQ